MPGVGLSRQVLVDLLAEALAGGPHEVVDLGGGTGGLAVALANAGHRVTVIDPSPDALAALERRAAEAGVADRLTAWQGDSATLTDDISANSAQLVLCHDVLGLVDDPAATLAAVASVLRAGGGLSLITGQRYPQAVKLAAGGDFRGALEVWGDPTLFGPEVAAELLTAAGFAVRAAAGLGLAASQIPDEASLGHSEDVLALERLFGADPGLLAAAPWLHVYATKA